MNKYILKISIFFTSAVLQYLVKVVGEDNLVELSVIGENIPYSQGFYL